MRFWKENENEEKERILLRQKLLERKKWGD